ncbi:hypothetical protein GCM10007176_07950 [Salinicoccus roseus]|nr:hypothetical protein GCM10007176_07950 [Salinicoccus roseus]
MSTVSESATPSSRIFSLSNFMNNTPKYYFETKKPEAHINEMSSFAAIHESYSLIVGTFTVSR